MAFRTENNRILKSCSGIAFAGIVVGAVACSAACGDGDKLNGKSNPTAPALGGKSVHAIHVFAKDDSGTLRRLDFGPGTEIASTANPSGVRPQAAHVLDYAEGGAPISTTPSVDTPQNAFYQTAWALVIRAAQQCEADNLAKDSIAQPWETSPEWAAWYVYFSISRASCSERLQMEQNLLCVSDKLAEVSDAVGTIVWPALGPQSGGDFTYGTDGGPTDSARTAEWQIPPQADRDRFIVRDLAIHTLGMLATLDAVPRTETLNNAATTATCAKIFSDVAT